MKGNVLIIEDDPETAQALLVALGMEGYAVRIVTSRDDALIALNNHLYQYIILDYNMAGMTAEAFIKQVGNSVLNKTLLMTASENAKSLAHRLGIKGFLGKPFEIPELYAKLDSLHSG